MKKNLACLVLILIMKFSIFADCGINKEEVYGKWKFTDHDDALLELTLEKNSVCRFKRIVKSTESEYIGRWDWFDMVIIINLPDGYWRDSEPAGFVYRVDFLNDGINLVDIWYLEAPPDLSGFKPM